MPAFSELLESQFHSAVATPELSITRYLKNIHGSQSHLVSTTVCSERSFPLSKYLRSIGTYPAVVPDESHFTFDFDSSKDDQKVYPSMLAGITVFTYADTPFRAYQAAWTIGYNNFHFFGLVFSGSSDEIGQKLASEVYKYANILKNEIWVYEGGSWVKSKVLHQSVRATNWDDVVLADEFKEGLRRDTQTFFESEDVYDSLCMTWKRGILLLGPPGNGKTESIKALLNESKQDALYVKSFTTPYGPEHGVRTIFDHARKHAPCILVLEDLDSMVTPKVRSYLLNELDGLAQNNGILTIATTNHPERIDDAILNRPSRFDVKYDFTLPSIELRKKFAKRWVDKIQGLGAAVANDHGVVFELGQDESIAEEVAKRTEGWSFAFLKELFVSYLLRLAHDNSLRKLRPNSAEERQSAETILMSQIEQLSSQILNMKAAGKSDVSSVEEDLDGESSCSDDCDQPGR